MSRKPQNSQSNGSAVEISPQAEADYQAMLRQMGGNAEALLLELLRRLFRLSENATIEDINHCVAAACEQRELMASEDAVALSARGTLSPVAANVCRHLGISEADYWRAMN